MPEGQIRRVILKGPTNSPMAIRVYDAFTGEELDAVQAISISLSIDDAYTWGRMIWIDFPLAQATDFQQGEVTEDVEIVGAYFGKNLAE